MHHAYYPLLAAAIGSLLITCSSSAKADGLLIRHYDFESGANGQSIGLVPDLAKANPFENTDLLGIGATYMNLASLGRTGLGASFDGAGDYISGASVNLPNSSEDGAVDDLTVFDDRGLQFHAYPNSAGSGTRQDLVFDTNQHGVYISSGNTWGIAHAGMEHDTGIPVDFNSWTHVQLISYNGAGAGAVLYLDGEAVADAPGGYQTTGGLLSNPNALRLTLGANTGTDFDLGLQRFYRGVLDDVKIAAYGANQTYAAPINLGVDNDAIAAMLSGIAPADVNLDGSVSGNGTGPAASDDVTAFVEGWMSRNRLPSGRLVGDVNTRLSGDLNFDGVTDIADWAILNLANPAAGAAALSAISGAAVPEPSTLGLAGVGLAAFVLAGWRRTARRPRP